jgi:glycosyltransferase involved in cell wall biosynthesis
MLVKELIPLLAGHGCRTGFCALLPSETAFMPELEKLKSVGCSLFVPEAELRGWQRVRQAAQAIRVFKPDLIVAHTVIPAAYARAAAMRTGWRIFPREDHKLAIALQAGESDDYEKQPFRLTEKILTYFADAVVTVNDMAFKNYCQRIRRHPGIQCIANGIDLTRFRAAAARRAEIRTEMELGDKRLVLQVGRVSKAKQQLLSLEAMLPQLRADPKLVLWFAGMLEEPDYSGSLQRTVQECRLPDQVRILGSRKDVPELLAAADLFLMPSTIEAHSVALIEAMASGVPMVVSDIPSSAYAACFPGLILVGVDDAAGLANAAQGFLSAGKRYERNLDDYDIAETERRYRGLINQ